MGEGTKHRLAFDAYVRLGAGRSLEGLHAHIAEHMDAFGLSRAPDIRTIYAWSSKYHWQDRLADLEREACAQDRDAQLERMKEMKERHIKEGIALQQKGVERLAKLPPENWAVRDAIEAISRGIAIERSSLGEQSRREIAGDDIDLSGLTIVQLRAMVQIAERSAAGDSPKDGQAP